MSDGGLAFIRQTRQSIEGTAPGLPAEVAKLVMEHREAILAWLGRGVSDRNIRVRIPTLKIEGVHKYIAAVGRALERGQLEAKQANGLLYAAQLLIAAHRALGDAPRVGRRERNKVIEAVSASIQTEVRKCLQRSPRRQHGKI